MNKPAASITENTISVYCGGILYPAIEKNHPNFEKIKNSIKNGYWELIPSLINLSEKYKKYVESVSDDVTFENGVVTYKGKALDNQITKRIIQLKKDGFEFKHLLKFIENLMQNPSYTSIKELYGFLEHKSLPITEDGHFLAYKAVRSNYKDIFTGTFDNSVGKTPKMNRSEVDDNRKNHCSKGLHLGAITYAKKYGHFPEGRIPDGYHNKLMIVKVNPKNAVSVPEDHDCTKLRVCEYDVIGEISDLNNILNGSVYSSNSTTPLAADLAHVEDEEDEEFDSIFESDDEDSQEESDDYFIGRSDGANDKKTNTGYHPVNSTSKKYMRGYKNGYEK